MAEIMPLAAYPSPPSLSTGLPVAMQSVRPVIPLAGSWKFKAGDAKDVKLYEPALNDSAWTDIKVPDNWYLEGQDISGVAWYRKHFELPKALKGKRVSLNFAGVDYMADVWLNGRYLGFHEGYFQHFSFDASDVALFGKDNVLTVKVDSPLEAMGADWSLHKRLIKGIFGHHDTRPGGAWSERGQEHNTGGIWGEVDVEFHDVAEIFQVKVSPVLDRVQDQATANVAFQVNWQRPTPVGAIVRLTVKPYNFASSEVTVEQTERQLTPGYNPLNIPVTVKHARLWWPWEQGEANLYAVEVAVLVGGKVIDNKIETFGFREVAYDSVKKIWLLNGQRLFLRGTNYIASQWLGEMTDARFAYDVALMKAANINAVRIHAHITAEAFYRRCDEEGLLVWQDFPLLWGYVDDAKFRDNAVRQAQDMVNGYYNHPSIITWSLINEPAWDAKWMKYKYKSYTENYNKLLNDTLYTAIAPMDNTRHVHAFSGTLEHPWLGWYSGVWQDYNKPAGFDIITEYGAQALPGLPSLRKIFSETDLWPTTEPQWDNWEYHNFQRKETFTLAKVPMGANPAEFVGNTQAYQVKVIKLAAESYRRQRYQPVNSIFQFMFVEDWPSMNWGVVDYWRIPKAGYYALQQAYQPVLPSFAWEQENFKQGEAATFTLWLVNDLQKTFLNARLAYSLRNATTLLETNTLDIDIAADSGLAVKTLAWHDLPVGHYELVAKVETADGKPLGINTHEFAVMQ
ncbi:MAG: glycoside hydrolase family 2 TIM barrel-domain containing protein [Methylovulum sp.]|nr:glycoside hydrolase family 2 TIM barrel-domain containing protein [Methylovulum sp.]